MKFTRKTALLPLFLCLILCSCNNFARSNNNDTPAPPQITYNVKYTVSGIGGRIYGDKTQTVPQNENAKPVSVCADTGFTFKQWRDSTAQTTSSPVHQASDVTENHIITAEFEQKHNDISLITITTAENAKITSRESYTPCTITFSDPNKTKNCGTESAQIRGRGNASWNFPKKGYKLKFDEKVNLLGIGERKNKDWTLTSCYGDQSMLRNYAALRLGQLLDGIDYSPACTYAEVYLGGEYLGVYLVAEQVEEKPGRVNTTPYDSATPPAERDYLLELDMYAGGEYLIDYIAAGGKPYSIKSTVNKTEGEYLLEFMTEADNAVKSGEKSRIAELIDLDSLVDTYILQEFTKNIDVGWSSMYLQKKSDGLLYFTAPWDFDLAFGNDLRLDNGSSDKLYAAEGRAGFSQNNPWFITLFSQEWFREDVAERWSEIGGILDTVYTETKNLGESLIPAMERNYERWQMISTRTHQQPETVLKCQTYQEHVEYLLTWYNARRKTLDALFIN